MVRRDEREEREESDRWAGGGWLYQYQAILAGQASDVQLRYKHQQTKIHPAQPGPAQPLSSISKCFSNKGIMFRFRARAIKCVKYNMKHSHAKL